MGALTARLTLVAPLGAVLVAIVAAFVTQGAGLTDAARAIAETAGMTGDGAATWQGVAPLSRVLPQLDPTAGHVVAMLIWVSLVIGIYGLGRRLALGAGAAGLVAVAVAAHPVGAAAHGDLAASGVLVGLLGMVGALWALLTGVRDFRLALAATVFVALGVLGHPIALLTPVFALLGWWAKGTTIWRHGLAGAAIAAIGLGIYVLAAASAEPAFDLESGPANALSLVGRAARAGVLGLPLTRQPWDLGALDLVIGSLALAAAAIALWRAKRPASRFGMAVALASLIALGTVAWLMPAPQPPALILPVTIGIALALGGLVAERASGSWVLTGAGLAIALLLILGRPVSFFASELTLTAHELDALSDPEPLRAELADRALQAGAASNALRIIGSSTDSRHVPTKVRSMLSLKRWNDAQKTMRGFNGPARVSLECSLAAVRSDVRAGRLCRESLAKDPADYHASMALARAYARTGRKAEAEQVLMALVKARPSHATWDALIDHYLRNGWVQEAVVALEQRLRELPTSARVKAKLVDTLLRKTRGDLLEQRWEPARDTALRLLDLSPARHQVRFYLADALDKLSDKAAATRQREMARAAGATEPPPVAGIPGAKTPSALKRSP